MQLGLRTRCLLWTFAALVVLFLIGPLFVVVPVSFSANEFAQFPPVSYSTQWYGSYFHDPSWRDATILSLKLGATVTIVSLVCGGGVALALARFRIPFRGLVRVLAMTPLIVPTIVVALAVYSQYVDFHLVGTFGGLVAAHSILSLPYVVLLVTNGLQQIDEVYEEASSVMGAGRLTTLRRVVLPMLAPSLASAAVFAFVTSWDEVVMVLFLGGRLTTLPLKMFTYLQTGVTPTIAAVSTMLIALVMVLFIASSAWARIRRTA